MTVEQAFEIAPDSPEKTALIADLDALHTEIATAQAAGAFSSLVGPYLQDKLVKFAEEIASNMTDHS